MARTWFAGPPTKQMVPPPAGAASKKCDPRRSDEGVLSTNKIAVDDIATAHQITPTKAIHLDPEPDGPVTRVAPFTSWQKELNTQPAKKAIDASAALAKLVQQHSKAKDPRTAAASLGLKTSQPAETTDAFAPSSSMPRRAPTARMVPLTPNTAVTTTPAATAKPDTSTTSLFGPCPSPMTISSPQALFCATALPPLPLASILPSSPAVSSKRSTPKKSKTKKSLPKVPQITLTPAPATAPSAFRDAAVAVEVRNTKLLSPLKRQSNGVKKRQHVRTPAPPKSVPTPESATEGKRGRGRPRTRSEKKSLQEDKQHRSPVQPSTPSPRPDPSNQSSSSPSAPSACPLQQQQTVTVNINTDPIPQFCSEEPRLWPGRGDHVASLLRFNSMPEPVHSEPVRACTNHAAHQDPLMPHGHGICTTCRSGARRHIKATRPELLGSAWWPLCKACGDNEMQHTHPNRAGCSCANVWLCFSCLTQELERRSMRSGVEAAFRRRTFVGAGVDGDVKTVMMGWACECGGDIRPSASVIKCIGCQGMVIGKLNPQEEITRETTLMKNALAWT